MRTSWKLFISAILFILGIELNLWGDIFIVNFSEFAQCILFVGLLVLIFIGILSSKNLLKDLGIMAMLVIGMYYFAGKIPFETILGSVDSILLGVISIAMIVIAVVILVFVGVYDVKDAIEARKLDEADIEEFEGKEIYSDEKIK